MCMFGDNDCRNNIQDLLRRDMWVLPMMGLSAMNVLVILAFEIFVICKATGNSPSRRYVNIFEDYWYFIQGVSWQSLQAKLALVNL